MFEKLKDVRDKRHMRSCRCDKCRSSHFRNAVVYPVVGLLLTVMMLYAASAHSQDYGIRTLPSSADRPVEWEPGCSLCRAMDRQNSWQQEYDDRTRQQNTDRELRRLNSELEQMRFQLQQNTYPY